MDALVQGGREGLVGDPEGAVTLRHGIEAGLVSRVWRPAAGARRAGGNGQPLCKQKGAG